jgi:shikimate kinase
LNELIRAQKPSIIATGGGLPCFEERMKRLNDSGLTVYLRCSPEKLYERISADIENRPLIEKGTKDETIEFIRKKIKSRESIYEMAHHKIDAGRNIDEVRKEMLEWIRQQAVE